MHFYPHNIADFNNATRHLTRVERSVYRDAIERYYDTEEPLPASDFDRLCRVLLCSTDDEKKALSVVLDEFFTLADGQYRHDRCEAEIDKYRKNTSAKARAGRASAISRKNKDQQAFNTCSTDEQLTNNQEPINNKQEKPAPKLSAPKRSAVLFKSFLADCRAIGEKPISAYRPVFEYAESIALPTEFVSLCWDEFFRRYNEGGTSDAKRYTDWRKVFYKCVEGNWFKLWWLNPGTGKYELTTAGHTAQRAAA